MRSAFCMMGMAIAALPLMEAVPLMDKGAHALVNSPRFGPFGVNATDANFDLSDFFQNSF